MALTNLNKNQIVSDGGASTRLKTYSYIDDTGNRINQTVRINNSGKQVGAAVSTTTSATRTNKDIEVKTSTNTVKNTAATKTTKYNPYASKLTAGNTVISVSNTIAKKQQQWMSEIVGGTASSLSSANTSKKTSSSSSGNSSVYIASDGGIIVDEEIISNIDTSATLNDIDETITWNGETLTYEQYNNRLLELNGGDISGVPDVTADAIETSLNGIFGMPYQFSEIVDPRPNTSTNIGRKFNEKILSLAPVLFLTPGEPAFMVGYNTGQKAAMADRMLRFLDSESDESDSAEFDEGRYYSFSSMFGQYKKYANTSLRALAYFMGIGDCEVPIPGTNDETCFLKDIDMEKFLNNDFSRLFGTQTTVPFFLDAETQISEDFSNDTTESMLSSLSNGFSSTSREVQFLMGSKDAGGLLKSLGNAVTDVASNLTSALGDISDALIGKTLIGKNMVSRVASELTTIVSGGQIVFPEIWSSSDYSKSYNISLKLRSPDPDPVSIFLNIYMPIVLLISMAAPKQINASSNSYESPFLVRATYKSIFSCDLGIISSLSITKGGEDKWNVLGQPVTADVTLTVKDLYHSMFISKRMGLIANTAQMDHLATMAGVDLNVWEPYRIINLAKMIVGDVVREFPSDLWGGFKRTAAKTVSNFLGSTGFFDTRFLG